MACDVPSTPTETFEVNRSIRLSPGETSTTYMSSGTIDHTDTPRDAKYANCTCNSFITCSINLYCNGGTVIENRSENVKVLSGSRKTTLSGSSFVDNFNSVVARAAGLDPNRERNSRICVRYGFTSLAVVDAASVVVVVCDTTSSTPDNLK